MFGCVTCAEVNQYWLFVWFYIYLRRPRNSKKCPNLDFLNLIFELLEIYIWFEVHSECFRKICVHF